MASGLAVCQSRGGGLLLAFRKERIDRCRLLVVVNVGEGVGDGNIGIGIVGCECFVVSLLSLRRIVSLIVP